MRLIRLLLRRHRAMLASWSILLFAVSAVTVSAYQNTYPTPQQRRLAVELAGDNPATTLLYGRLAQPGTPAMMFTWEIGAFVTILAAVMAVLLAVGLTRGAEDNGTLELVRSCGVDPRAPLRAVLAVLAGTAVVLAAGCTIAVGSSAGRVDAVGWPGALCYGAVVGLTFLLMGTLTAVLAQVASGTTGAHLLAFTVLGAAFGLRAIADTRHLAWLNWSSPLALRAVVRPFDDDRWWAFGPWLAAAAMLAWLAARLGHHREYRAGLLRPRQPRASRLRIRSGLGLTARLARRPVLTWTIAVACLGTLFSAMGSGVLKQSRYGDIGGFLGAQLGSGDAVAAYFAYSGTVVGIVVAAFAVLDVLRARREEVDGLVDHILATGVRRWQPLAWRVAATCAGSAVILLTTGVLSALVAPTVINGAGVTVRAFAYSVGQWPATAAAAGWTALLAGRWPRLAGLAWAPLVASSVLALLGRLLKVPQPIQKLGVFQHVPDFYTTHSGGLGLAMLLAASVAMLLGGITGIVRRDLDTR